MNRIYGQPVLVFDAKDATGVSKAVLVKDFTNISIALHGDSSANLTVKLVGSTMDTCPDFSTTQAITNSYDFVQSVDLQNGATINGDTGVVFSGAADDRNLEANVNALTWVALRITARSAGTLSAYITPYSI